MREVGRCLRACFLGSVIFFSAAVTPAAEGMIVDLSGRVWREGNPFNGKVTVVVELFGSEDGDRRIWVKSLRQRLVSPVLSIALDRGRPGLEDVTLREDTWLQLSLDGELLRPRRRLWSLRYVLGGQALSSKTWRVEADFEARRLSYRFLPEAVEEAIGRLPDTEQREQARAALVTIDARGARALAEAMDFLAATGDADLLAVPLASRFSSRRWPATRRLMKMEGRRATFLLSRSLSDPQFEWLPMGGEENVGRHGYFAYLPGALRERTGLDVSGHDFEKYEDRLKVAAMLDEWAAVEYGELEENDEPADGPRSEGAGSQGDTESPSESATSWATVLAVLGGAVALLAGALLVWRRTRRWT